MTKGKIQNLDDFSRIRLSEHFFMRDFIFSETAAVYGLLNIPTDRELAIESGRKLCQEVLEPLQEVWGRIHIRSAFRSQEVNALGNELGANCSTNERNFANHIWDKKDVGGYMGATACIVIPRYLDYYQKSGDWQSLAWWIHHHIPAYQKMTFFTNLCAFNIRWHENAEKAKEIKCSVKDKNTGKKSLLDKSGQPIDYYASIPTQKRYAACTALLGQKET